MRRMQEKCGQGLGFKAGARSGMTLFVPVASVEIQLHCSSGCQCIYRACHSGYYSCRCMRTAWNGDVPFLLLQLL